MFCVPSHAAEQSFEQMHSIRCLCVVCAKFYLIVWLCCISQFVNDFRILFLKKKPVLLFAVKCKDAYQLCLLWVRTDEFYWCCLARTLYPFPSWIWFAIQKNQPDWMMWVSFFNQNRWVCRRNNLSLFYVCVCVSLPCVFLNFAA